MTTNAVMTDYPPFEIHRAYTEGDCWHLAQHLAAKYELTAMVVGEFDAHGDDVFEAFDWHHAFVQDAAGNCYDVDGVSSEADMIEKWGDDWGFRQPTEVVHADARHFKKLEVEYGVPVEVAEQLVLRKITEDGYTIPALRIPR